MRLGRPWEKHEADRSTSASYNTLPGGIQAVSPGDFVCDSERDHPGTSLRIQHFPDSRGAPPQGHAGEGT